jgi:hypothetical protein
MELLEDRFADSHVPTEFMTLYRMLFLIRTASIEKYLNAYGPLLIRLGDVEEAMALLDWGPSTPFERECVDHLNDEIDRRAELDNERNTRSVVGLRAYG